MNERERAICARVKQFRETIRWPQPAVAQELGITRDKLASIEYGRSPLRYKVGVDLCEVFDINAEWIVTGKGDMHGGQPALWVIEWDVETLGNKLFSEVYDECPDIFQASVDSYRPIQNEPTPGFNPQVFILENVVRWFAGTKFREPIEAEVFARALCDFGLRYIQIVRRKGAASNTRVRQMKGKQEEVARMLLTDISLKSKSEAMSEIQKLIKEVKRRADKPGARSELAKYLGVAPARISEWLSGKKEPGGEYTLRLLKWVAS